MPTKYTTRRGDRIKGIRMNDDLIEDLQVRADRNGRDFSKEVRVRLVESIESEDGELQRPFS